MDAFRSLRTRSYIGLSLAIAVTGCKSDSCHRRRQPEHPGAESLSSDQNLSGQPIQASVANGVVTLGGTVTSDTARTIASGDAAQIAGVQDGSQQPGGRSRRHRP